MTTFYTRMSDIVKQSAECDNEFTHRLLKLTSMANLAEYEIY